MHYVSRLDDSPAGTPAAYEGHSDGYTRAICIDHRSGSVHMGVGLNELAAGGTIQPHRHSFEESFYILEGNVLVQVGEQAYALGPGHFGLISTGVPHSWRNASGGLVRWLEMQAPQPRPIEKPAGRDTFFVGGEPPAQAGPPDLSDPNVKLLGHFDEAQLPRPGEASQMEGFNPTSGVAVKMFVDRSFGAIHQSLFLIQYMPGAKIDPHDHAFEESYLIVSGQVEAVADDKSYQLGPGSIIWTGVGCVHSFTNNGPESVRWIETQAPLPPAREVFRFERDWVNAGS